MTCACESIHPFPCQFPGEMEFFDFDGKKWCRFHLPLQDANGHKSAKGRGDEGWKKNGWEEGGAELKKFTDEILTRLRAATPWEGFFKKDTRADLKGVVFPKYFQFTGIADRLHVNFTRATFGDWAGFDGVAFGDMTDFASATFGFGAIFFGATFGSSADFRNATFGFMARFVDAVFGNLAHFDGAIFGNNASFSKANFQGDANFSAGAEVADLSRDKEKTATDKFNHIDFSDATFTGPCSFVNRAFTADANFNGAVFHDLVSFHGCTFHPGMSFHQTKFLKTKGETDDVTEALERSYRTLKLEMEKLRARNEEADFFALEMECRRQRGSVPWFERFAATAYKHLSDYGRAVDLPLIWLLILTYAAHYLYLPIALMSCNPGAGARFGFTLEQMFRPFYVWAKSPPGTGNCLVDSNPVIIPILASLQSLGTIGLLALFLLALRRRFKMD